MGGRRGNSQNKRSICTQSRRVARKQRQHYSRICKERLQCTYIEAIAHSDRTSGARREARGRRGLGLRVAAANLRVDVDELVLQCAMRDSEIENDADYDGI